MATGAKERQAQGLLPGDISKDAFMEAIRSQGWGSFLDDDATMEAFFNICLKTQDEELTKKVMNTMASNSVSHYGIASAFVKHVNALEDKALKESLAEDLKSIEKTRERMAKTLGVGVDQYKIDAGLMEDKKVYSFADNRPENADPVSAPIQEHGAEPKKSNIEDADIAEINNNRNEMLDVVFTSQYKSTFFSEKCRNSFFDVINNTDGDQKLKEMKDMFDTEKGFWGGLNTSEYTRAKDLLDSYMEQRDRLKSLEKKCLVNYRNGTLTEEMEIDLRSATSLLNHLEGKLHEAMTTYVSKKTKGENEMIGNKSIEDMKQGAGAARLAGGKAILEYIDKIQGKEPVLDQRLQDEKVKETNFTRLYNQSKQAEPARNKRDHAENALRTIKEQKKQQADNGPAMK